LLGCGSAFELPNSTQRRTGPRRYKPGRKLQTAMMQRTDMQLTPGKRCRKGGEVQDRRCGLMLSEVCRDETCGMLSLKGADEVQVKTMINATGHTFDNFRTLVGRQAKTGFGSKDGMVREKFKRNKTERSV
jgi:hypothetical protein